MIYEFGAILILLSTIPQMIRTYQNRHDLRDISFGWLLLGFVGACLLIYWALQIQAWMVLALEVSWAFYALYTMVILVKQKR